MANSFYNVTGWPATSSFGFSSSARGEMIAIQSGFDKLPVLGGGVANAIVVINSAGTAITTSTALAITPAGNVVVATPASGIALTVNQFSGSTAELINTVSSAAGLQVLGSAATQLTALSFTQSGQSQWQVYQPASSNDFRIFGNAADRLTITNAGVVSVTTLAVSSSITITGTGTLLQMTGSDANSINFSLKNTIASGRDWVLYSSGGGPAAVGTFGIYNNTGGGNSLTISPQNNVVIAAPGSGVGLSVNGGGVASTAFFNTVANSAVNYAGGLNSQDGGIIVPFSSGGVNPGAILFYANTVANTPLERMRIPGPGGVSIATPTSGVALTVNSLNDSTISASNGTQTFSLNASSSSGTVLVTTSNHGLVLGTNNAIRQTITNAGNFAFATPTTGDTLVLNGVDQTTASINTSTGGSLDLTSNGGSANSGGLLQFGANNSGVMKFAAIKGLLQNGTSNSVGDLVVSVRHNTADATLSECMRWSSAGSVTIAAPSSGATLNLTGITGNNLLQMSDGTTTGVVILSTGTYIGSQSNHSTNILSNNIVRLTAAAAGNLTANAPASGVTLTVSGVSGTHSTKIADSATNSFNAGFLEVPQNLQTANYAFVLADSGKHVYYNTAGNITFTIPANASVAYPIGTVLTIITGNSSGTGNLLAITTDTLRLSPGGATGTRTIGANARVTAVKVAATEWQVSGTALT